MKSVTLRPTKTMIDTHDTNSCIWLGNSKQTEEQIHSHTHKKPWVTFDGSVNRSMASFCHCWSAYAGEKSLD